MNNIFENAYFGKSYKTRDGRKTVFYNHHNSYAREKANYVTMILEGQESIYRWYYDGTAADHQEHLDIISEWKEPIDEEKLGELAWSNADSLEIGRPITINHVVQAYKAGYHKALGV